MTRPPQQESKGELANLDFLRAGAVFLVFTGHLLGALRIRLAGNLGHLGVLIFFVHTALVLMLSMDRLKLSGFRLYAAFMVRRVFRIYPLSILSVIFVTSFHFPRTPWGTVYEWPGWAALASNIFLTQNITQTRSINCVLWSLPFEIQMYLVLPILFLWLSRSARVLSFWGIWLMAACLASAEYFVRVGTSPDFLLLRYVPCFFAGIFAWRVLRARRPQFPGWGWVLFLLAAIAAYRVVDVVRVYGPATLHAFGGSVRSDHGIWWPPYLDMFDDWIFCAIAGLAIPLFHEIRGSWLKAISKLTARYSYGIYVCHVPILWLCFHKLRLGTSILPATIAIILTAVISFLLYRLLEAPAIDIGRRWAARVASLDVRGSKDRIPQGV